MRFSSDKQRKAVMASINKFAMKPVFMQSGIKGPTMAEGLYPGKTVVEGFTGSEIVTDPVTKEEPFVYTSYGSVEKPKGETIILAGKGYESVAFPKSVIEGEVEKASAESGLSKEAIREIIPELESGAAAGVERFRRGYPVFAKEPNEGMRRHKLMPEDLRSRLPQLYSQENEKDPMVWGKFFSPYSGYTLYITEFDGDDTLFGYVTGMDSDELGYSSLNELASAERGGLPLIERDKYFTPKRLSEVKKG